MYNCIIIGAGPAGSTAAYHLAKRDRSVLVLEKASLPRYKSCGGGVSPVIKQWFDCDFAPVIDNTISQVRFSWQLTDPLEIELKKVEPMWVVHRDKFDHFLTQQAQKQGAELQDNTEVLGITWVQDHWQVKTANQVFKTEYLIAADGVQGKSAAWLGFAPRKSLTGATLEIPTNNNSSPPTLASFDFGFLKGGYIWTFPKKNGYTISGGCFKGSLKGAQLQKQIFNYAQQQGINTNTSQYYEYPFTVWSQNQPLHTHRALLAGEAAGVVDPLLGEGVRPAILTGVRAAEAIDQALTGNGEALANYSQIITQEWGNEMAWAQKLAGIFYQFPQIAYKVAVKRPAAGQLMGEILCGQLKYSDVTDKAMQVLKKRLIPGFGRA